ncbi:ABC transporter, substrate binding protein [Aeropyrum pernix K1]|uniref:ABC transporter, substrate binding protein n=1 Tax=Aeropyrum pernix (strain ATCC 700893 / DSM 11879 / JCM 9820 / NBRC 100138 / K1) TaxID=272557 RepID=Q9YCF4_AERPE|nr:ABC transporter substrate-binding protein [Aeropyrum pernix]BAA80294.2 ABC transporter, substrate binding protein [Aeropyrum pernix K1]
MAQNRTLIYAAAAIVALIVIAAAAFFLMGGEEAAGEGGEAEKTITINVGLLVDETGPTSDVGKGYSLGAELAFKYFNEKGIYTKDGVRVNINYIKRDYAYNPTTAEEYYREFRDRYGVIAIIGWGTADTEKLSDQVDTDKITYISASYSAKLLVKPFNFYPAPDYSTQACSGLAFLASEFGQGKLALAYDSKVAYSRSPIGAIKKAAPSLGLQVVGDYDLPLRATEADAERIAREMLAADPDYVWCGNTISSCSLLGRAMAKVGLDAFLLTNVWGFDERSPQLIGEGGYGKVFGISPFIYPMFGQDVEGIQTIFEAARMNGVSEDQINLRVVQGFVNVWLLIKAIESVTSQDLQERGGEALKEALEANTFDLGGITADTIDYEPGFHLAYRKVFIIKLGENGELQLMGKFEAPSQVDCARYTIEEGG